MRSSLLPWWQWPDRAIWRPAIFRSARHDRPCGWRGYLHALTPLAVEIAGLHLNLGTLPGGITGIVLGMIICLAVGTLAGLFNGVIVVYGRIQPIIATLATGAIYIGIALFLRPQPGGKIDDDLNWALTNALSDFASTVHIFDDGAAPWFAPFAWIPTSFVLLALIALLVWVPFRRSITGRTVYAIGSAEGAAYMSGLNINLAKIAAFTLGGFFAACGGLFLAIQTSSGNADLPQAGTYTLNSIAAVVIGGTSLLGGTGGAIGSIFGALILRVISFFFRIYDIAPLLQPLFEGIILLAAVSIGARGIRGDRGLVLPRGLLELIEVLGAQRGPEVGVEEPRPPPRCLAERRERLGDLAERSEVRGELEVQRRVLGLHRDRAAERAGRVGRAVQALVRLGEEQERVGVAPVEAHRLLERLGRALQVAEPDLGAPERGVVARQRGRELHRLGQRPAAGSKRRSAAGLPSAACNLGWSGRRRAARSGAGTAVGARRPRRTPAPGEQSSASSGAGPPRARTRRPRPARPTASHARASVTRAGGLVALRRRR
jgi:ribose transport system permease protein